MTHEDAGQLRTSKTCNFTILSSTIFHMVVFSRFRRACICTIVHTTFHYTIDRYLSHLISFVWLHNKFLLIRFPHCEFISISESDFILFLKRMEFECSIFSRSKGKKEINKRILRSIEPFNFRSISRR